MKLHLLNICKNFEKNWVFKNFNIDFSIPGSYALIGANGSGKSTLLRLISGQLSLTSGAIKLILENTEITSKDFYKHIVYAAPYLELIEEMYLDEFIDFYTKFKPLIKNIRNQDVIRISYLEDSKNKQIKNFSSGMKQRLKLALAWLTKASIVLLDEPCSNLDEKGIKWYQNLALKYSYNKLIIICSNNIEHEFYFCDQKVNMGNLSLK